MKSKLNYSHIDSRTQHTEILLIVSRFSDHFETISTWNLLWTCIGWDYDVRFHSVDDKTNTINGIPNKKWRCKSQKCRIFYSNQLTNWIPYFKGNNRIPRKWNKDALDVTQNRVYCGLVSSNHSSDKMTHVYTAEEKTTSTSYLILNSI